MLECILHCPPPLHSFLPLLISFDDKFGVPYLTPADVCCWKTFSSWTGSLSGVAVDGLGTEHPYWAAGKVKKRKALTGGAKPSQGAQPYPHPPLHWGWR